MGTWCNVLLLILISALVTAGHGKFIMQTPLRNDEILCLDECQFQEDNQTIIMINVTDPKVTVKGVAYYSTPVRMKDPATRTVASFNTSFTFREEPKNYNASPSVTLEQMTAWKWGDGFTFMMSNSSSWKGDSGGRLGIFSSVNKNNPKVVALEFDNYVNADTDKLWFVNTSQKANVDNHVGLDIGTATSIQNCLVRLQPLNLNISLWQRNVLHVWIEYDGITKSLQLRLANTSFRPHVPILNCTYDLYDAVDEKMWIGFSAAIGDHWTIYYMYNWTFTSFGISADFPPGHGDWKEHVGIIVGVSAGSLLALVAAAIGICVCLRRKRAQNETWDQEGLVEMANMPEFISYKHLSAATKQFSDQSKLGQGAFGSVYRGVLPKTGAEVAVKKVSSDSRQGEREFLAEVQIISQLRHRNVVELLGFCRDRGKFLLVYELLPNGSLNQALFHPKTPEEVLSWSQRWKIVSGTAAALHYLHEGWRQQVIHRDVKSSNIMLDDEYNAKLGDFGLARLVDHQKTATTTMVAGTFGYIAPEASAGGKFTDKSDVFAFGAVCLEIACGRRACDSKPENTDDHLLVDMVWRRLNEGDLLTVADPLLLDQFDVEQMIVILKLGLLCSHPDPAPRPSMRQVVQVLAGDVDVPEVPESKPKMLIRSDRSEISIDDLLMSSRSGTETSISGDKHPDASTSSSMPSSSFISTGR